MAELPKLPPPPPELDFPAMETMRQQMVAAYGIMLNHMQEAMARVLDDAPGKVRKSEPGYTAGVDEPQAEHRAALTKVLRRLGTPAAHFERGGDLYNVSDAELRILAKEALAARR